MGEANYARHGYARRRPFVFSNLKVGTGLMDIIDFILKAGGIDRKEGSQKNVVP